MLKFDRQRRKLNNKGMTLIEVIITVTLLVLVSGFILSAFTSAMRAAGKSRDVHRATTVAQNLMEGINLKKVEEMAHQFSYPYTLDGAGNRVDNFNVYPSTMFQYLTDYSVGELMEWTDPTTGTTSLEVVGTSRSLSDYKALTDPYEIAGTKSAYMSSLTASNYDFLEDKDGKYIYYLRNIKNDGRYYNAKITLDASTYTSAGASGLVVNEEKIISVPTIDSTYDAVEVMKQNLDLDGLAQMQINNASETVVNTLTDSNLYRIIEIEIDNALMPGPAGKYRTSVKVNYYYYIKKADNHFTTPFPQGGTNTVFDNAGNEDAKQLRSVYLYYYPLYVSGECHDTIVINNPDNMDMDFYIIKQEPTVEAGISQSQLSFNEEHYQVKFNVLESTDAADGKSHIKLHTNWNENIASIYTGIVTTPNQVKFERNSIFTTKEMYNMTDIKNKQAKNRIYDVTVDIYQSEYSNDLNTFYTSTPVSEWFKDEDHLISMKSSISQ